MNNLIIWILTKLKMNKCPWYYKKLLKDLDSGCKDVPERKWALRNHHYKLYKMRKKTPWYLHQFNNGLEYEVYHEKRSRKSLMIKSLKERIGVNVNLSNKLKKKEINEIMILNHQVGPNRKGRGCRCGWNRYHNRGRGRRRRFRPYKMIITSTKMKVIGW